MDERWQPSYRVIRDEVDADGNRTIHEAKLVSMSLDDELLAGWIEGNRSRPERFTTLEQAAANENEPGA